MIVGLTGGIGSGKSFVEQQFNTLGVPSIDTDRLAKALLEKPSPLLDEVYDHFPASPDLHDCHGNLDRRKLRKIIFSHDHERQWLENLIHPAVQKTIKEWLSIPHNPYGMLVSPLLIEKKQSDLVDRVIVVDIGHDLQIQRACKRDHSQPADIINIINTQTDRTDRLAYADDIIDNNGMKEETTKQIALLHTKFLKLC